jgi:intergrase/recombinase
MLERIREMIQKLPVHMGKIIKFACLIGLRPAEVVESVKLINNSNQTLQTYYKPERMALEHFRFPDVFFRTTKKAYISFVTPEIWEIAKLPLRIRNAISYNAIRLAAWQRGMKLDMRFCRKVFASHLRQSGVQAEIVDLLQGRVPQSVLTRHYLVAKPSFKDDVLQGLEKLKQEIER